MKFKTVIIGLLLAIIAGCSSQEPAKVIVRSQSDGWDNHRYYVDVELYNEGNSPAYACILIAKLNDSDGKQVEYDEIPFGDIWGKSSLQKRIFFDNYMPDKGMKTEFSIVYSLHINALSP